MKIKVVDSPHTENYTNTVKAPNIKHNSSEVKDVCYFADLLPCSKVSDLIFEDIVTFHS
jgi:hypothetical protein